MQLRVLPAVFVTLPMGFAYVAGVLCGRANPLASSVRPFEDWLAVTLSAPVLFIAAVRPALGSAVSMREWTAFLLPFFAGLHWEFIGTVTGAHFSLTAHDLTRLTLPDAVMLAIGVVLLALALWRCGAAAQRSGVLGGWLACWALLASGIGFVSLALPPGRHLHIHHYFWALCSALFFRFPTRICLVCQGVLLGIYVEGAARWGFAPLWN